MHGTVWITWVSDQTDMSDLLFRNHMHWMRSDFVFSLSIFSFSLYSQISQLFIQIIFHIRYLAIMVRWPSGLDKQAMKTSLSSQSKSNSRQKPKLSLQDERFKCLRHGSAGEESAWSCCRSSWRRLHLLRPVKLLEMIFNNISTLLSFSFSFSLDELDLSSFFTTRNKD